MRRSLLIGLSIVVSAVFLWLALRDVPLADVGEIIQQADIVWVIISVLCVIGAQFTRAVRWYGLLNGRVSTLRLFHIFNAATFINQLPLRVGEIARVIMVNRSNVPVMTGATSILIERLIDVVSIIILLAISLNTLPNAVPVATQSATLFGIVAVTGLVVLILFARFPTFAHKIFDRLEAILPFTKKLNLRQRLDEMIDGLKPLTQPRAALHLFVWNIIAWAFSLATFYALLRAFNLQTVLQSELDMWIASAIGIPLVAFSVALPVSVAGLGPIQGAIRIAGEALGIEPTTAAALGIVFHVVTVGTYCLSGALGLLVMGVSFSEVFQSATNRDAEESLSAPKTDE